VLKDTQGTSFFSRLFFVVSNFRIDKGRSPGEKRPLPDSMFADVSQRPASREVDQKPIRRQAFNCVLTMPFLLWHFSPGDKIENCSAQFLAVCSLISAAPKN
jgi:hypothetical protein